MCAALCVLPAAVPYSIVSVTSNELLLHGARGSAALLSLAHRRGSDYDHSSAALAAIVNQ